MNPFTVLTSKIFAGLSVVLLLAVAVQSWRAHHYEAKAEKLEGVIRAIRTAQKQAGEAQAAVNREPARKSEEIARKSDVDAKAYYDEGRRAGAAYADAHRVRNSCAPGGANLSGADSPAPVDDGAGHSSELVAVSREDFDTLTGNSVRLAKVQQDAQALIDAGVAVALPEVELSAAESEKR